MTRARCWSDANHRSEAENGVDQIALETHEVGVESSILAIDLGSRDLPALIDGLRRMIHELRRRGLIGRETDLVARDSSMRLLTYR